MVTMEVRRLLSASLRGILSTILPPGPWCSGRVQPPTYLADPQGLGMAVL